MLEVAVVFPGPSKNTQGYVSLMLIPLVHLVNGLTLVLSHIRPTPTLPLPFILMPHAPNMTLNPGQRLLCVYVSLSSAWQ